MNMHESVRGSLLWPLQVAVNALILFVVYVLVRLTIFTPYQWMIDYVLFIAASTLHFWYRPHDSLRRKILVAVTSGAVNVLVILFVVFSIIGEAL